MNWYGTHEAITRKGQPAPPMRIEDVVLRPMDSYPDIKTFRCSPLRADITPITCKANYLSHKSVSCRSCPVGMIHAGVASARTAIDVINDPASDRHVRTAVKNSLPCIRCLKSAATNKRLIGGMRLIGACWCVSCANRQYEVRKGANSKNAKPVKWAGLRQTVLTIEDKSGKWVTLAPIMTTGRHEAERYVERKHPGHTIVECFFDGVALQPTERPKTFNDIAREAGVNPATARSRAKKNSGSIETPAPRKPGSAPRTDTIAYAARQAGVSHQTASYRLKKYGSIEAPNKAPTGDTPPVSPAWHQVFGDPIEAPKQRKQPLPPLSIEEDAAYRRSFDNVEQQSGEETVSDFGFDSENLADAVALTEAVEPVLSDSDEPTQDVETGLWDGVAVCWKDGEQHLLTDLAAARGVDPETLAIELSVCEPEGDEPDEEQAPELIARPAYIGRTRKLTKAEKKAEKKARQRDATAQQSKSNGLAPTMLANTCKAFVHVMFELAAAR